MNSTDTGFKKSNGNPPDNPHLADVSYEDFKTMTDAKIPEPQATATLKVISRNITRIMDHIRGLFAAHEQRMDDRFAAIDVRFAASEKSADDRFAAADKQLAAIGQRMNDRFAAIEQSMKDRFASVDKQLASMNERFASMNERVTDLRTSVSDVKSTMRWAVGLVVAAGLTVSGILYQQLERVKADMHEVRAEAQEARAEAREMDAALNAKLDALLDEVRREQP